MGSEWPLVTLAEAGAVVLDCEHKTPSPQEKGLPYLAIPNVQQGRIDLTDVRLISQADYEEWTRRTVPREGDILLTRRGRVGDTAPIPANLKCAIGQNLVLVRSKTVNLDQAYLRWALTGPSYQQQVYKFLNVGAVFDSLNVSDIPKFEIPLPPLPIQRQIAAILSAFDDKIELNRQMNRTLEQVARALFKSWFVDFDPVRAKMRGEQPEGMDAATAALFPAELVEVDGREVPKGWELGTSGKVMSNPRRTINPKNVASNTPYIGLEHMPRGTIQLDQWGKAEDVDSGKVAFEAGEILFGKLRPYFKKVGIAPIDGIASTDILVIRANENWQSFVLMLTSSDEFISAMTSASGGTRMPRASWSDLANFSVVLPEEKIVKAFDETIKAITDKINSSTFESNRLAQLRDALLPRLLSGEVDVSEWATEATT